MPEPIPRQPRRDDAAADVQTLEDLGRIDEQPVPSEAPPPGSELPPDGE